MFRKILLSLIIILLFSYNGFAIVNTLDANNDAQCISRSYGGDTSLIISEQDTVTNAFFLTAYGIDSAGSFTSGIVRVNEGTATANVLRCGIEDPDTTSIANLHRTFFMLSDGTIAYSDLTTQDGGAGAYTTSNTDGYHTIGTITSPPTGSDIIINSVDDIFASSLTGTTISVFDASAFYAQSTFYTIDAGHNNCTLCRINDIAIDSSDRIWVLLGSATSDNAQELSVVILDIDGSVVANYHNISNSSQVNTQNGGSKQHGFIIPDTTNPLNSFTFSWYNGSTSFIVHNSSGTYETITQVTTDIIYDGWYNSGVIWYTNDQSEVVTVATSYTGFDITGGEGVAENTYNTASVDSLYSTYYNNSNFFLNYYVSVDTSLLGSFNSDEYLWEIDLVDPNGVVIDREFSDKCDYTNILFTECVAYGTLEYPVPSGNWTNGTWYAKLYEYNVDTTNRGLLDTSENWTVYNNSSIPIPTPSETLESGTGATTLNQIDGWVGLLGLGVNGISKFLFAMILILSVTFFGFIGTKGNSMGGAIAGSLPFTFFVFIEFIPVWTIIIVVMVVAIKTGWFR